MSTLQEAFTPASFEHRQRRGSDEVSKEEGQQLRHLVGGLLADRDTQAAKAEAAVLEATDARHRVDDLEARLVLLAGEAARARRDCEAARGEADATLARHESILGQLRSAQKQIATLLDSRGALIEELRRAELTAEGGFRALAKHLRALADETAPALVEVREAAAYLHARSDVLLELAGAAVKVTGHQPRDKATETAEKLVKLAFALRLDKGDSLFRPSDDDEVPVSDAINSALVGAKEAAESAAATIRVLLGEFATTAARGLSTLPPLHQLLPSASSSSHTPSPKNLVSSPTELSTVRMPTPPPAARNRGESDAGGQEEAQMISEIGEIVSELRQQLESAVGVPSSQPPAPHGSQSMVRGIVELRQLVAQIEERWGGVVGDVATARGALSTVRSRMSKDDGEIECAPLSVLASSVSEDFEALLSAVLRLRRLATGRGSRSAGSSRRSTAESIQSNTGGWGDTAGVEDALGWLEEQRSTFAMGDIDVAADLELLKQRLVEAQVDNRTLIEETLRWKAQAEAMGGGAPHHPLEYPSSALRSNMNVPVRQSPKHDETTG
jgi:hypothetical protein